MIFFKKSWTVGLVMTCGIPALAQGVTRSELEQRGIDARLMSVQSKIRSVLDRSEQFVPFVRNEMSELARKVPALDSSKIQSWTERCNFVRSVSDSQLSQLAAIKIELGGQRLARQKRIVSDQVAQKLEKLGRPIFKSLQDRTDDLVLQHEELRRNIVWGQQSAQDDATLQMEVPQSPQTDMRDVFSQCNSPRSFVQVFQSLTPRVAIDPVEGSLLNVQTSDTSCENVRAEFTRYVKLFDESARLLNVLANGIESEVLEPTESVILTGSHEKTQDDLQKVLDAMAATYPDSRFSRNKEYRLHWNGVRQSPMGGFFDFAFVRFGPNTWESSWDLGLLTQDWALSEPALEKNGDVTLSLKASVHDICIDRRQVLILGSFDGSPVLLRGFAP